MLIDRDHRKIPISRQYELLDLSHSSLYYRPRPEDAYNETLMRLIDEQYNQDTVLWGSAHDCVAKELNEAIQDNAQGPAEVSGDSGSAKRRPLRYRWASEKKYKKMLFPPKKTGVEYV